MDVVYRCSDCDIFLCKKYIDYFKLNIRYGPLCFKCYVIKAMHPEITPLI